MAIVTFISAWLQGPDRAYLASDREFYRHKYPCGQSKKLAVNCRCGVAGVHAGHSDGNELLTELIARVVDFDELARELPVRARDAQADVLSRRVRDWAIAHHWKFGIAGWSPRHERVMAAVLLAEDGFALQYLAIGTGFASPYVSGFDALHPTCAADLSDFGHRQLAEVRKTIPDASDSNTLDVAVCVRPGVAIERSFDIRLNEAAR